MPQTQQPATMTSDATVSVEILLNPPSSTPNLPEEQFSLLQTAIDNALPDPVTTCTLPLQLFRSVPKFRTAAGVLEIEAIRVILSEDDSSETCPKWCTRLVLHPYTHSSVCYYPPIGAESIALPSKTLENRWESLHFSQPWKSMALAYMMTRNRLEHLPTSGFILLHGPPGSGKSTMAEGLAQKVCVRLGQGVLLRVTHETLSKYFGESANRVGRLFQWAVKQGCVVVIIIDEIESFGLERCHEGGDLRVTNALLTGLDSVRRFTNVFVIGTSNCVTRIDGAIRDRADLRLRVLGMGRTGVETVLRGHLEGLVSGGLLEYVGDVGAVVEMCDGLSGRRVVGCVAVAVGLVEGIEWEMFEKALRKAVVMAKGVEG